MTSQILTMIVMLANGRVVETRVGVMSDRPLCDLAGLGIATVLMQQDASLTVGWTCEPEGAAA